MADVDVGKGEPLSRTQRWLAVSIVGIGVFSGIWWFAEAVLGMDRGTAQALAGLAFALVTTPAGWWFALDSSPATRRTPGDHGEVSASRSRRSSVLVVVVMLAIVVTGVAIFANQTDGSQDSPNGGSSAPKAGLQNVTVNKTVWYAGLKVTVGVVSYDPNRDAEVLAEMRLENLSKESLHGFDFHVSFKSGTQYFEGRMIESNPVPALTVSDYAVGFEYVRLAGPLEECTIVFGGGEAAQALVPLGSGDLVTNEPRTVVSAAKVVTEDLTVTVTQCELRADFVPEQRQTARGKYVLGCEFDVHYDGDLSGHYFDEDNVRVRLPDGTSVSPTYVTGGGVVVRNETLSDVYGGFTFKWPAPGKYTLQIIDTDGDPLSASNTFDVPFTV